MNEPTPAWSPGAWFCGLHRTWSTGDCPRCDDDLIATHDTDED